MIKTGPFFKRFCAHTAVTGFVVTWLVGLGKGVSPERIFVRSLLAAALFWMLGAFAARYAFGPYPPEQPPKQPKA